MLLTDHVRALKIPFTITVAPGVHLDRFVYTYIVLGERICILDTGVAGSEAIILGEIGAAGRRQEETALIAHTHTHPDHIGSTAALQKRTGCSVAVHPAERRWIEDISIQEAERPVPNFRNLVGGSARVDRLLGDGDIVDLGGCSVEVIATPGHSPGSVSFLVEPDRVLCSGDAVPLAGELPIYDDALASAASVRRLMERTGVQWLGPAWDDPCRGAAVRERLDSGLRYLVRIQEAVGHSIGAGETDPAAIAASVLASAGATGSVNPLVIRSILATIRATRRMPR